MNVLETEWWTLALPPEWWADSEDDSILVGDRDDVGCIEISTLRKDSGEFDADEVSTIARSDADASVQWREVSVGDFTGLTGSYAEEGVAIRQWCLASGAMLLYITYSCDDENSGMDDSAVDQILDTLMLVEEQA